MKYTILHLEVNVGIVDSVYTQRLSRENDQIIQLKPTNYTCMIHYISRKKKNNYLAIVLCHVDTDLVIKLNFSHNSSTKY